MERVNYGTIVRKNHDDHSPAPNLLRHLPHPALDRKTLDPEMAPMSGQANLEGFLIVLVGTIILLWIISYWTGRKQRHA